jgi:hypothetical protein
MSLIAKLLPLEIEERGDTPVICSPTPSSAKFQAFDLDLYPTKVVRLPS